MKNNEKILVSILIAIAIIVIIVLIATNKNKDTQEEINVAEEKYVKVLQDGTKLNTSDKLKETKTIDEMQITNLQLSEKNNSTVLLGTITNNTAETKGDYFINIKMLDEKGHTIEDVTGYIGVIKPGQSTQLNCGVTADYANAYDFEITKK